MKKRITSILLVLCLVCSLVPAGSYYIAEAAEKGIRIEYKIGEDLPGYGKDDVLFSSFTYEKTGGFWKYHDNSFGQDTAGINIKWRGPEGIQFGGVNNWIALKINVPVSGTYKAEVNYAKFKSNGGRATAIVLPLATDLASFNASTWASIKDKLYCSFDCRSGASSITWQDTSGDDLVAASPTAVYLEKGEYYLACYYTASGTNVAVGDFTIYTVDESGNAYSGYESAYMGTVTAEKETIALGKTTKVSAVLSDSITKEKITDVNVTYTSSNPSVLEVSADGTITAKALGKATITAESPEYPAANFIGTEITVGEPVESGVKVFYDIGNNVGVYGDKEFKFSSITYSKTNNFWEYDSNSDGVDAIDDVNFKWRGPEGIQLLTASWFAMRINVPKKGEYVPKVRYGRYKAEEAFDVYLFKADGTTAAEGIKDSTNCLGRVKTPQTLSNVTWPADSIYSFAPKMLEAGEYYLVYKHTGGTNAFPSDFYLDGGDGKAYMGATIEINDFVASVRKVMSDGNLENYDNVNVTYSASPSEIAEIDAATGVITPKKRGNVEITAKINDGENETVIKKDLLITEFKLPCGDEIAEYNFTNLNSAWTPELNPNPDSFESGDIRGITYEYTSPDGNGNWEYYGVGPGTDWTPGPSDLKSYQGDTASSRLRISLNAGQWVALTIKVPKAGKYTATLNHSVYHSSAGTSYIYIVPKDTQDVNAALTNANLIGTVNHRDYSVTGFTERETELGNIDFYEAGEYLLVFKLKSGNKSSYLTPRRFILNGENSVRKIDATADKFNLGYDDYAKISIAPVRLDGEILKSENYTVTYKSLDVAIANVDNDGNVHAFGDGTARIEVTVDDGMASVTETLTFNVTDDTGVRETQLKVPDTFYVGEKSKFQWNAIMNSGNLVVIPSDSITCVFSDESVATAEPGFITAIEEGSTEFTVNTTFRGESLSANVTIAVIPDSGKSEPTYYSYERREIAQENISKYDWAKSEAKTAITDADKVLEYAELLYSRIYGEGIPRSRQIGRDGDPEYNLCRYCGSNIVGKYGGNGVGGWNVDSINRPWKIQCPDCKRLFPSNDFESFLKLGLDEKGYFDLDKAYENHRELFADEYAATGADQGYGYLKNDLYPELYNPNSPSYNLDPLKKVWVDGKLWGVDDSMGYLPVDENGEGRKCGNNLEERLGYVAFYNVHSWSQLDDYVNDLALAYVYTGDIKYGRAGAILLDRIADVYPSFDIYPYRGKFLNTHGGSGYGSIVGRISDCDMSMNFALAADAFYPALEDAYVINFLAEKAKTLGLENEKTSSKLIWDNIATGILRHVFTMSKDGKIYGNYGQQQSSLAIAAVVLDNEPETQEMIEWIYQTGGMGTGGKVSGGNLDSQLVDVIDRDGYGNEGSPYYNAIWSDRLLNMAETLALYEGKNNYNPFEHPKFAELFRAPTRPVAAGYHHAQIGDAGAVAGVGFHGGTANALRGFMYLKDTVYGPELAEYVYLRNNYNVKGLHYGIFDKDPERAEKEILEFIDAPPVQKSDMMTGFGFASLRAGRKYLADTASTAKNTLRDFWMYFGGAATSHGHLDTLNIGVQAYGLNFAPEMGYPQNTSNDPNRLQWVSATISHNTVLVDERNQEKNSFFGTPIHFDDSGKVKVMDVDGNGAYNNTENYRRTIVMVEANDDVSYGVDFFRVTGGNAHTFSFHAQSEKAEAISGLELTKQVDADGNYIGTYAGPDTEYGNDPNTTSSSNYETFYPRGYTWMTKVRRDTEPENNFAVDFEITDYRHVLDDSRGLRLRLTQVNDFTPDEVAIVAGMVPVKTVNAAMPDAFEFVLVQRKGNDLDSLFTTVYEPYKTNRYLESIEPCTVEGEVTDNNMVKAVKVTHVNGRVDYVVYATDNTKTYRVADLFDFRGFVGVYSLNSEGTVIYRYVHDGDIIGEDTDKDSAYSGTVSDFTRELSFANHIDVKMECDDVNDLSGRYIYVENDGVQNGAYCIRSAEDLGEGKIRLNIGTTSVIRGHKDPENIEKGYIYNIKEGQNFIIPSSFVEANLPVFASISDGLATSVGSGINIKVTAESPIKENTPSIEYVGTTLPRGASVDAVTGTITWKPTASQVGDSHFEITARDSDGRENTVHFNVKVYGSTSGTPSSGNNQNPGSGNTGTSGTGGGTGGGTTEPVEPEKPEVTPDTEKTDTPEATVRFIDLGAHAWAADAINALAEEGIIKGTSENTYSPGNNITRADFALLLVRAFKLESDNTENFADVLDSDYFAKELAIARNTGIIGGIGDNKYAPKNFITRQDMMVIVYRALVSKEITLDITIAPDYEDFADVSDYAKEAVTALIGAGLVNGKNNRIEPNDNTTRAEVAVLLQRVLDYVNK